MESESSSSDLHASAPSRGGAAGNLGMSGGRAFAIGSSTAVFGGSSNVARIDMSDPRTKAMIEGLQATVREWDHYAGFWHGDRMLNEWTVNEPTRLTRAWRFLWGRRWYRNPAHGQSAIDGHEAKKAG